MIQEKLPVKMAEYYQNLEADIYLSYVDREQAIELAFLKKQNAIRRNDQTEALLFEKILAQLRQKISTIN